MSEQILLLEKMYGFTLDKPLPMSWSQIGSIDTCLLKWYLDYEVGYRKFTFVGELADYGKTFHKYAEDGFNDMKIIKGEIDLYGGIDTKEDPIPKPYLDGLYFIEDWIQKRFDATGDIKLSKPWKVEWKVKCEPEKVDAYYSDRLDTPHHKITNKMEKDHPEEGKCDCRHVGSVWIKRIGVIDIVFKNVDGKLWLWDIKTGKSKNSGKALRQLYYYKSIVEKMTYTINGEWVEHDGKKVWKPPVTANYKVHGIGVIFPHDKLMITRVDEVVPRGTENSSRISKTSISSVEKLLKKSLESIVTQPITANWSEWYCPEWCAYSQDETLICDFEEEQDLSRFPKVTNRDELIELVVLE